jgi:general L-amino acid transport system permease protein
MVTYRQSDMAPGAVAVVPRRRAFAAAATIRTFGAHALTWARKNLFCSVLDSAVTIVFVSVAAHFGLRFFNWALVNATAFGPVSSCNANAGACWVAVADNINLFLFGTYPAEARWRALVVLCLILGSFCLLFRPELRRSRFSLALYFASVALSFLMLIGWKPIGLAPVDADRIGGVVLTVVLSWVALPLSLPLALFLALGRQSDLPVIRAMAISYIEIVRGLPMVVVLFLASVILPLLFQGGLNVQAVFRALLAITLFSAAYQAEVIRGGLQAVSGGQVEAGRSLGLSYWAIQLKIVIPQALSAVVRPMAGVIVLFVKDTSLVSVVGLFELAGITSIVITKPEWTPFAIETYFFAGSVYVTLCFAISRLASSVEHEVTAFRRR